MNYSKFTMAVILGVFLSTGFLHSQIKIITSDYQQIFGYILEDNDSLFIIKSIQDENFEIFKTDIKVFEKIEVTLHLKNKQKISGNISGRFDSTLVFINSGNEKSYILFSNIVRIYTDEPIIKEYLHNLILQKNVIAESKTKSNKSDYSKVGLSIGTPGMLNLNIGRTLRKSAFNFSVGFTGLQFAVGRNLVSSDYFEMNVMIHASYFYPASNDGMVIGYYEGYLIGPLLDFNLVGFNLQAGIGFRFKSQKEIPVFLQLGYNYRFRS